MPAYTSVPGAAIGLLTAGVPAYCFGSFNDRVSPTRMSVSNVALTSNVATLTVLVLEGNIPAVGSLITVRGVPTVSGAFNVTQIALSGVTIDATSGAGTVTYALTHADVVSVAASGGAVVQTPEVGEALANGSSVAWSAPFQASQIQDGHSLLAVCSFPSLPTTATISLEEAIVNQDAEFSGDTTIATVSGGAVTLSQTTVTLSIGRFYRMKATSVTGGTLPTIVGKLLI
jgi:hypothetical protein